MNTWPNHPSTVGPWVWNLSVETQYSSAIACQSRLIAFPSYQLVHLGNNLRYLPGIMVRDVEHMGNGSGLSSTCDHSKRIQTIYY